MKKSSVFSAVLLLGAVIAANLAKAQDGKSICLHDGFGYVWTFTSVSHSGSVYSGTGTVDIGAGFLWNGSGSWDASTGATTLRADNPQADGCFSGYTDYFQYDGTATAGKIGGVIFYSGSGTWLSYCSGVAINSGTWSATDCAHKNGTVNPNGPAKKH